MSREEPWFTKQEVARLRSVSPKTIQRYCRPHRRIGGRNRYLLSEVDEQLPAEGVEPRPVPVRTDNVVELRPRSKGAA